MSDLTTGDEHAVHGATQEVITRLLDFDLATRRRILKTVQTFLFPDDEVSMQARLSMPASRPTNFEKRDSLSPKEFLLQKRPQTDVERVACLAYYLTHYRDTRHFKTTDVSLLNTEAAQVKFSNTAYAMVNAMSAGLLVPAGKGARQLSAAGERYVELLPDRAQAKEALTTIRNRRRRKAKRSAAPTPD